jgi:hypothetical protein
MQQISREDLRPVLESHRGNAALQAAIESVVDDKDALLSVLGRYIQFNGAFGPGLANLAGEIAARRELFSDRDEPVRILQDRASDVASDFFHAAVDEFDDRATPWRDTHRTLAQATLKGLGRFFGYEPAQLNDVLRINHATDDAMRRVQEGYGLGAALPEERLFRGMGFHTGSEVLADEEFTIIDRVLRAKRPDLVKALEAMKVEIVGSAHNAYYWIFIHTSVEADHFDAALKGVNKALRFYAGPEPRERIKGHILAGFRDFADVQQAFMDRVAER